MKNIAIVFTIILGLNLSCAKKPAETDMPPISDFDNKVPPGPPRTGTGNLKATIEGTDIFTFSVNNANADLVNSRTEVLASASNGEYFKITIPTGFVVGTTYSVNATDVILTYYDLDIPAYASKSYTCSNGSIVITENYSYAFKGTFKGKVVDSNCNWYIISNGEFLAYW